MNATRDAARTRRHAVTRAALPSRATTAAMDMTWARHHQVPGPRLSPLTGLACPWLRLDEAVALLRVEPLDGSLCHVAPYRGWIRVRAVRYPGRFSTRLSPDP